MIYPPDWLNLLTHLSMLSLFSFGGPMGLIPDIHRYLVNDHQWIENTQFTNSIVLAQAFPGPNILFLTLLGWNIGLQSGGYFVALIGGVACLLAYVIPSSIIFYFTSSWVEKNKASKLVRSFKAGMSPIVIALLIASGVVLASANGGGRDQWGLWLLVGATVTLVLKTKIPMLLLLLIGGCLGALGVFN
ncbi:hypothetical protein A9236_08130 [Polynucleobacter sp. QLW-P1DATA-2]|uniref:chromate transporter n=1 Tax=unclassified Polynucleobacter TaxID=2640945 RepID=UPI0008F8B882|nr:MULTISPECIES: chromate transporter [unclassified Polynucleobacter]OIN01126.1 hypothetical protein A9236_08130 [Polynucleobacter sp. QLW-P1DATA-2]OIN02694.1 hypothetical protein A9235_03185 [Polynucleobacter sp. MWH-Tro8-2-5-gr]